MASMSDARALISVSRGNCLHVHQITQKVELSPIREKKL